MELFFLILKVFVLAVAYAFVICAVCLVASMAYYAYLEMKEAEKDD